MSVKQIRVPGTGVLRAMLIVLSAAILAAMLAACGYGPRHVPDNDSDRAALVAFYQSTNGLNWTNKANWLSDQQMGAWHGVTTDGSGRVTHLELPQNGMTGQIPPELGNLDNLLLLNLSWNRLSGPIPPELGNLASLTSVYLHGNGLSGPLPPELGSLHNLTALSLCGNQLNGPAPPELLANMPKLTWLSLDENRLTGCVPTHLRDQLPRIGSHLLGLRFCDQVLPPRPCREGMTLKPGDYCTIDTPPQGSEWHPAWPYLFKIRDNFGCIGSRCSSSTLDREGFRASENSDGSWDVHSVP